MNDLTGNVYGTLHDSTCMHAPQSILTVPLHAVAHVHCTEECCACSSTVECSACIALEAMLIIAVT